MASIDMLSMLLNVMEKKLLCRLQCSDEQYVT